jgi:formylglycine-generating enzyme required for sulfatase activity
VVALLTVLNISPASAVEERRVALIIGNDSYKSLKRLDNGANDARAMAAELKAAGFETVLKTNAGRKEMHAAIGEFGGKLASGSVGLFYYAGHGIQSGERNFLVPVDADLQGEDDLDADAIDIGKVMKTMEAARNRLNIVILDACRDNPLPKGGRSGTRGLAVIPAPTGTFVAYATGPGKIAQDGDRGGNGVYTGELVKALRQPGLKIEEVFKKAANGVMEKTGGKQVPWTQASLQGDFYFRPQGTVAPPAATGGNADRDALFWSSIKDSRKAGDFEDYLTQFPNGTFAGLATRRIGELRGGQTASLSPGAVARPEPLLDALDREMVAGRKANVREFPEPKAKQISTLAEGDTVQVTGRVKGENWYLVSRKGNPLGYVVTDTLEEVSAYKARKDKETQLAAVTPPPAPPAPAPPPPVPVRAPGSVFRDCTNCPEMVVIPPGSFIMGASAAETSRLGIADNLATTERPQHHVNISRSFALGKYHVTYAEWDACLADGGCNGYRASDDGQGRGNRPVVRVSWVDAQAYVTWLNGKVRGHLTVSTSGGGPYRLPSEAEWEYAARAGTTTPRYWGEAIGVGHANCDGCGTQWDNKHPAPVGSFAPNPFGLYDMQGNAWQWTGDCFNGSYAGAPSDGSAWTSGNCDTPVYRGGSWFSPPKGVRSSMRSKYDLRSRDSDTGFRIARTLP